MAAAAARAAKRKSLPRRPAEWVRPYLLKSEAELLIASLEKDEAGLMDPSLASALHELKRAVRL